MDFATQLAAQQQAMTDVLEKVATGFDGLSAAVDKMADSAKKAGDEEENKQKKLTDYEKKRLKFEKKYDKELKSIQKRFAVATSFATKIQNQINNLA